MFAMLRPASRPQFAEAPTHSCATHYNMNHKRRGLTLIFYHENFTCTTKTLDTKTDCADLENAFNMLDFEVSTYYDFTWKNIKKTVKKASKKDHSEYDCIVIVILTHGEDDFLYAQDETYLLNVICDYFTADNCPTLAGKPKLFFIEAPRGENLDSGVSLKRIETDGERMYEANYTIPIHADFLFVHSTIPNFHSLRDSANRSWFIQSLVAELNTNAKKIDLLAVLTLVNRRVAIDFPLEFPSDKQKQIPCITSMLTRILLFNDKIKEN